MSAIDKDTVARVARLARIRITEPERERLVGELSRILDWVEQLNEAPTDAVEPMVSGLGVSIRLREDDVTDGGYSERVLENAPQRAGNFFTTPKVVG